MLSRLQKNGQLITDRTDQTHDTVVLLQRKVNDLSQILSQVMKQLEVQCDEISCLKQRCSAIEGCNKDLQTRADASEKTAEKLQKAVLRVTKGLTEVANSTFTPSSGIPEPITNGDRRPSFQSNPSATLGAGTRRAASGRSSTQKPRKSVSIDEIPSVESERIGLNHTVPDVPVPSNLRSQTLKLSHLNTTTAQPAQETNQNIAKGPPSYANIVQNMNVRHVMADGRVLERIKLI
ncbi:BC2 protein [Giardia lamblia P15]|uniref:BC2 protein n=2 Tax=Giardia intestinalis TaxID=5741 RepID=E1F0I6_GIAIA|nr:BC2-ORF3/A-HLG [Giardia intestinalis]EFO64043.1 BC2 protein [Giardia lamblia P15]